MRALKAAVIAMAVLIVAGVAVIGVTIANRVGGGGAPAQAAQALLDEPAGTRIAGVSVAADRLAVQLQGGGPDRVVVLEARGGRVLLRAALAR
jgi:hypothetical protein